MTDNVIFTIPLELGRISRIELNLMIAELISLRSTCCRGKNGAVIIQDGRIISTGYNGTIISGKNCNDLNCNTSSKCVHAMHAERNAIAFAAKKGISTENTTIYITSNPCYDCAMAIIQAGIIKVIYRDAYLTDQGQGLNLLRRMNIEVIQHGK